MHGKGIFVVRLYFWYYCSKENFALLFCFVGMHFMAHFIAKFCTMASLNDDCAIYFEALFLYPYLCYAAKTVAAIVNT